MVHGSFLSQAWLTIEFNCEFLQIVDNNIEDCIKYEHVSNGVHWTITMISRYWRDIYTMKASNWIIEQL